MNAVCFGKSKSKRLSGLSFCSRSLRTASMACSIVSVSVGLGSDDFFDTIQNPQILFAETVVIMLRNLADHQVDHVAERRDFPASRLADHGLHRVMELGDVGVFYFFGGLRVAHEEKLRDELNQNDLVCFARLADLGRKNGLAPQRVS